MHEALPSAHVVRTAWVYTGTGTDFVATMRELAAGEQTVSMVVDQIGSPTYVADLVSALLEIAERPTAPALLHIANDGAASRFEQARAVFEGVAQTRTGFIRCRARTRRGLRPARRIPRCPAGAATSAGLTPLRPWRDALAEAMSN